jgi:phage-related baseplate assembly protein
MDNTEIHYLTYDPDEILAEMVNAYAEAGGGPLWPGDEKEMLLQGVLSVIVQGFAGVDNALRMATLRYAVGEYLDIYGEKRNCVRISAKKATASIRITTIATGAANVIPAGTAVTQDGETLYLTDDDIVLSGGAQSLVASVTAEKAGSVGNGLLAGAGMQFLIVFPGVTTVVCETSATGGLDEEEDEYYRERIRLYGLTTVTTGPAEQYNSVAMAVSSVILDAHAKNLTGGSVGVYLVLSDDTQSTSIISAVQAALNPDDVRPLNDNVTVALATKKTYTLNVQYSGDNEYINLDAKVAEAVEEYQKWQDQKVGRAFNPDRLKALMYQAGCTRVIFAEGSEFDGGDAEYTEITDTQVCSGTISTEVIST